MKWYQSAGYTFDQKLTAMMIFIEDRLIRRIKDDGEREQKELALMQKIEAWEKSIENNL